MRLQGKIARVTGGARGIGLAIAKAFVAEGATPVIAYNYLIPMTRYGTPEEIANAAVFLSSDESRYIHGHTLNVDGGFRAAGLMFRGDKAAPAS
jgi:NAD(P)-dependent dehydrogenase (short-subunit alcohol dehydrogenase family)